MWTFHPFAADPSKPSALVTGLNAGVKSPLLWAPILGISVVLLGIHLPAVVASCFELIGSATSGVAVFAVGLVLAAHPVRFSRAVLVDSLACVTVQSAVLFALLHLLHVVSPFAREALVCCRFPWQPWSYYLQPGTKQSNQKPLLCFSSRHSLW